MASRAAAGNAPQARGGRTAGLSGALAAPAQEKDQLPTGCRLSQGNMGRESPHSDPRPRAGRGPGFGPPWESSRVMLGKAPAFSRTQQPGEVPWKTHSRAAGWPEPTRFLSPTQSLSHLHPGQGSRRVGRCSERAWSSKSQSSRGKAARLPCTRRSADTQIVPVPRLSRTRLRRAQE